MANQNTPKLYCGSGKAIGQYGQISVSLCLDELASDYITTAKNGKRYINLKLSPKKETDQYGKTHYLEIDTWRPNQPTINQIGQEPNWANSDMQSGVPF